MRRGAFGSECGGRSRSCAGCRRLRSERERGAQGKANKVKYYAAEPPRFLFGLAGAACRRCCLTSKFGAALAL